MVKKMYPRSSKAPAKPLKNSVPKVAPRSKPKNAPGNPSFIESPKRYFAPPYGQKNK